MSFPSFFDSSSLGWDFGFAFGFGFTFPGLSPDEVRSARAVSKDSPMAFLAAFPWMAPPAEVRVPPFVTWPP